MMQSVKMGLIALFGAPSSSGSHTDLGTLDPDGSHWNFGPLHHGGSPLHPGTLSSWWITHTFWCSFTFGSPATAGTQVRNGSPRLFMALTNDLARPFTMILTDGTGSPHLFETFKEFGSHAYFGTLSNEWLTLLYWNSPL